MLNLDGDPEQLLFQCASQCPQMSLVGPAGHETRGHVLAQCGGGDRDAGLQALNPGAEPSARDNPSEAQPGRQCF